MKKMSSEEYRKRPLEYLIQRFGEAKAEELMQIRGDDWQMYCQENYGAEPAGCRMIMGLL